MKNDRLIQILQELVNNSNNQLSSLNAFLQEAYSDTSVTFDTEEVEAFDQKIADANARNADLQSQIDVLNGNYSNLLDQFNTGSSTADAEIQTLRLLVDSLRADKDNVQALLSAAEEQLASKQQTIDAKDSLITAATSSIDALQAEVSSLNNRVAELLVELAAKQSKIQELSDTTDEVKAALSTAKSKIKAEMEEAMAEIDEAIDGIGSENVVAEKNGPYSDGFYKNGAIDTTFSTPFTAFEVGPDVFDATNPLLALDDDRYYSYTKGIAKPYGSQIVCFLPDGTPQTMDNGNWGPNYVPQTPYPMQAVDGSWYVFPGGTKTLVSDSDTPVAIQKIGPKSGDYEVYYTFKDGIGTAANGSYDDGTYSNGLLIK